MNRHIGCLFVLKSPKKTEALGLETNKQKLYTFDFVFGPTLFVWALSLCFHYSLCVFIIQLLLSLIKLCGQCIFCFHSLLFLVIIHHSSKLCVVIIYLSLSLFTVCGHHFSPFNLSSHCFI